MTAKDISQLLEKSLRDSLNIVAIEIINDSARHRHHTAMTLTDPAKIGNSHFVIKIVSDDFIGLSAVARQRKVYGILADFLEKPIHALNLSCKTTKETNFLEK